MRDHREASNTVLVRRISIFWSVWAWPAPRLWQFITSLLQARLKPYVELRGADSGPLSHVLALPALWVGLLYDSQSKSAALEVISGWTGVEIDELRHEVRSAAASASCTNLVKLSPACVMSPNSIVHPRQSFRRRWSTGPQDTKALRPLSGATVHDWGHLVQVPRLALQTLFRGKPLQDVARRVVWLAADGLRRRGRGEEQYLEPLQQIADSGTTLAERMLALYHGAWGGSLDPLYDGSHDY